MVAADTNVLVRLLTRDDAAQCAEAVALMEHADVWISRTVLLETEWVLRYFHKLSTTAIHGSFTSLLGLPNVSVEDPPGVARALAWFSEDMDFADALHLAARSDLDAFVTFDRKLIRKASRVADAVRVCRPRDASPVAGGT